MNYMKLVNLIYWVRRPKHPISKSERCELLGLIHTDVYRLITIYVIDGYIYGIIHEYLRYGHVILMKV
jgi:hypothetical protein